MNTLLFSIHTFECGRKLTQIQYRTIMKNIQEDNKQYHYRCFWKNNIYFCHKYQKRGLQIQISKNPYQSYYQLNLTVNPQTILHPDNLIWIYNTHTTPLSELFVQVNAMLSFLGNHYRLEHFILKRIDCCVDIDLQNNQTVEEYIRLLKKGNKPYGYYDNQMILKHQGKNISKKNGIDFINHQGIQFSAYNKYKQLLSIKLSEEIAKQAETILRVEVKLFHKKLKEILQCNSLFFNEYVSETMLYYFISNSKNILFHYLSKLSYKGTYYKKEQAITIIQHSNLKQKQKENCILLLETTTLHKNVRKAVESLKESYHFSNTKVNTILKQLEQLNINPVTIAKNRKIQKLDDIFQILVENEILFKKI